MQRNREMNSVISKTKIIKWHLKKHTTYIGGLKKMRQNYGGKKPV